MSTDQLCRYTRNSTIVALLMRLSASGTALSRDWQGIACSALGAIRHINEGNGSVVPELALGAHENLGWLSPLLYDTDSTAKGGIIAYRHARAMGASAFVGAARSAVVEPLAEIGNVDGLPMISYWATSPDLSEYPYFSRSIPSDAEPGRYTPFVLQSFGWRHASVIHVADIYATGYRNALGIGATLADLTIVHTASFEFGNAMSARSAVQSLVNTSNIIVLICFDVDLATIVEMADELGLLTPEYAWVVADAVSVSDANRLGLTSKLSGFTQVSVAPTLTAGFERYSRWYRSLTPADCQNDLFNVSLETFTEESVPTVGAYAYDAAVTVGLALHRLRQNGTVASFGDLSDTQDGFIFGERLRDEMRSVRFSGATGEFAIAEGSADRDPTNLALVMFNWVRNPSSGLLESTPVAELSMGFARTLSNLSFDDAVNGDEPPLRLIGDITWLGGTSIAPADRIQAFRAQQQAQLDEQQARAQEAEEALARQSGESNSRTVRIILALVISLALAIALGTYYMRAWYKHKKLREQLVWRRTKEAPLLGMADGHQFHLFLSHTWASGQDQVHVMKQRLLELVPKMKVFLDVDDLNDCSELRRHIEESAVLLAFMSRGYFLSQACVDEYVAGCELSKPFVLVHETNVNTGGVTLETLQQNCPKEQYAYVFEDGGGGGPSWPIIPWDRSAAFQLITLKKITAAVLAICPIKPPPKQQLSQRERLQLSRKPPQPTKANQAAAPDGRLLGFLVGPPVTLAQEALAPSPVAAQRKWLEAQEAKEDDDALPLPRSKSLPVCPSRPSSSSVADASRSAASQGVVLTASLVNEASTRRAKMMAESSANRAAERSVAAAHQVASSAEQVRRASVDAVQRAHSVIFNRPELLDGGGDAALIAADLFEELYCAGEMRVTALKEPHTLFYSDANPGAEAIALELGREIDNCQPTKLEKSEVIPGKGPQKSSFLLLLNTKTFVGDAGELLAQQTRQLLRTCRCHILLVHGVDPEDDGCRFEVFFETTPTDLMRDWKLFSVVAEPWFHDLDYRTGSVARISRHLATNAKQKPKAMRQRGEREDSKILQDLKGEWA